MQLDGCNRDAKKLQHAVTTSFICRMLAVDKIVSTLSSLRSISPKSIHKCKISITICNILIFFYPYSIIIYSSKIIQYILSKSMSHNP